MADKPKPLETAVPQRNFTMTTEERVRALAGGLPAWAVRLKRIEDLTFEIVRALVREAERTGAVPTELPFALTKKLAEANALIDKHNRYYPIEANLPMHPRTGRLMSGGEPWQKTPPLLASDLLARASGWWRERADEVD